MIRTSILPFKTILFTIFFISCGSNSNKEDLVPKMILIPGGTFMMGGTDSINFPDEYPMHEVTIPSFLMDKYEVTNRQFNDFVKSTGYVTTAERLFKYNDD